MGKKNTPDNEAAIATSEEVRRQPHWAMIGTNVREAMTAEEAMIKAGLDWEVNLHPLAFETDDKKKSYTRIDKRYASVRSSDQKVLGIVGATYHTFQNREAFTFADHLVGEGEAGFDTAFSQRGGAVVGLTMQLPDSIEVAGGAENVDMYLLLRTSHDGSKAIGAYITMIQQSCTNQTQLMARSAIQRWSITHVSTVGERVKEARDALGMTIKYAKEFQETADRLAAIDLELDDFRDLLEHVVPKRPKSSEVVTAIASNLERSTTLTDELRGTAWGGLHAITEYYDWLRDTRSAEAQLTSATEGLGWTVRNRAAALLLSRGR